VTSMPCNTRCLPRRTRKPSMTMTGSEFIM
jgi:hypothetical protein